MNWNTEDLKLPRNNQIKSFKGLDCGVNGEVILLKNGDEIHVV